MELIETKTMRNSVDQAYLTLTEEKDKSDQMTRDLEEALEALQTRLDKSTKRSATQYNSRIESLTVFH